MEEEEEGEVIAHLCKICRKDLSCEPKIDCAKCQDIVVCLECFSCGLEILEHRCDHPYRVDTLHLPRDETNWTLTEDRDLMQALIECGYGNEMDLGRKFMHRNTQDVMERVDRLLNLDTAPLQCRLQADPLPLIPYNAEKICEEPPRYPKNSLYAKSLAGYNAARGDFTSEYWNNAEEMLCTLSVSSDEDDSDGELSTEITTACVEYHNHILRERRRRKEIIKEHALILRKMFRAHVPEFAVFGQLLNRVDFDSLHEGIIMEGNLRRKMQKLRKYRTLGITRLRGITMYDKLEQMRTEADKELRSIQRDIPQIRALPASSTAYSKRPFRPPLDLTTLPKYHELTKDERALCTESRITPETFLRAKATFLNINSEEGSIQLKVARKVMKIDVNKTRKIFNFLRDQGLITEAQSIY